MRKINYLVMVAILMLSVVSVEIVAESDLDSRLKTELSEFSKSLGSLSGQNLIDVADKLTGAGLSDSALYSQIEVRLKKDFERHLSSPKDKQLARDVNALMRAYASFGYSESSPLLNKILQTSKSRGIRNRAVRIIPKLDWFKSRNQIMQNPQSYKPSQKLMTHRFLNLVQSDDPRMKRWASEEISRLGGTEREVYDAMALELKRYGKTTKDGVHLDALAWYCKILGRYDSNSSGELLMEIRQGNEYHKKLKKYARY